MKRYSLDMLYCTVPLCKVYVDETTFYYWLSCSTLMKLITDQMTMHCTVAGKIFPRHISLLSYSATYRRKHVCMTDHSITSVFIYSKIAMGPLLYDYVMIADASFLHPMAI